MVILLKKADIAIILLILIFSTAFYFYIPQQRGNRAVIKLDGKLYREAPLNVDSEIEIILGDGRHLNTLKISGGHAEMVFASCPDGLCKRQGKAGSAGEIIVCLPNRITVEILGNASSGLDGTAR